MVFNNISMKNVIKRVKSIKRLFIWMRAGPVRWASLPR